MSLFYAKNAKNVMISGQGEINGNGTYFMNGLDKPHMGGGDYDRKYIRQGEEFMKPGTIMEDGPVSYPFRLGLMMTFIRCENLKLLDIRLKDSPEWTIRIGDCDNVTIRGISIQNNQLIPNNDGIHCTDSRNVRISDCNISAGDDAIIVTGFGNEPQPADTAHRDDPDFTPGNTTGYAENVTVTNCVLSSRSACIRVGYGYHPIRNLVFSNLVMYASNRGIGVFARDKTSIDNVLFSNIIINTRLHSGHWWGKGEPIHISAVKDSKDGNSGRINNIRFTNIVANSETGILIYGNQDSVIENLLLDRIRLNINAGKYSGSYGGNFDLRPAYPLSIAIFKHDIPGLYAGYVNKLTVTSFELNWGKSLPAFFTNGIEVNNFDQVTIDGFNGKPAFEGKDYAAVKLSNGSGAVVQNCRNASIVKQNVR